MTTTTKRQNSKPTVDEQETNFLSPLLSAPKELVSEYRKRKKRYEIKGVHPADVAVEAVKGWEEHRSGKRVIRLRRLKSHDKWLEDRVWCLFCSMGYQIMSGTNFKINFCRADGSVGKKQVDVYAEDNETVLVIECKSREERGRRTFQKDIQETISLQSYIRTAIHSRFLHKAKPKLIWIYVTSNTIWSVPDIERAEDGKIEIITENELQYFETFVKHMGPAAKYQILGEFLKGQKVPGLANVKLPAIRGEIGGEKFYSFVSTPRNLLKIAFINHQALNHPDGRP